VAEVTIEIVVHDREHGNETKTLIVTLGQDAIDTLSTVINPPEP